MPSMICAPVLMSVCPSVYQSICLSVYLSTCSICLPALSVCLSFYLCLFHLSFSFCLSIHISVYQSVPSVYLTISVSSICPVVCLSVYPSLQPSTHQPDFSISTCPHDFPACLSAHRSSSFKKPKNPCEKLA